ncbi:hypothetical protein V8G56_10215 [Gaetbulibacter aquiaggeris]|uniref:Uncharacterized protein n=1 Tax=Gaetbulibacter aquiaggeris TaxID=1735373 RepID=A0ABW7MR46_9FLAO
MESQQIYKDYNNTKSLEEWLNNLKKQEMVLKELERELQFYTTLLYKPIFKSRVMNLYETLARFKYDLGHLDENRLKLMGKISTQLNQISSKIENKEVTFDNILKNNVNELETAISKFHEGLSNLKSGLFEYIQSTILD